MAIQVSWVAPDNGGAPITGYELWMSEESLSYELVFDGKQRSDILTFTVTEGISQTKYYHFKLRAINYVGKSEFSPKLTSLAAIVPTAPVGFKVTGSTLGSVSLAWEEPDYDGGNELLGYYVYYK